MREGGQLTLKPDMSVGEVIKLLLSSNSLCVSSGSDQFFYVRVADSSGSPADTEADGEGVFCIVLADLLEAPRQLPLNCLLGMDEAEECQLYGLKPEPYTSRSPVAELTGRLPWLVGLLFFLTVSSAILEYYDGLLQKHLVIAFYLTALVGCGGNSGSQAASLILQGLATGELAPTPRDIAQVLQKELLVGLGIAAVLSLGVLMRITLLGGPLADGLLIGVSMAVMVVFSVLFGALVPLALQRAGADPAKVSGPLLSTVIDIVGVLIACLTAEVFEALGVFS